MAKELTQEEMDSLLAGVPMDGNKYMIVKSDNLKTFCEENATNEARLVNTKYGCKCKIGDKWIKISELIPPEIVKKVCGLSLEQIIPAFNISVNSVVNTQTRTMFYEVWIEPKEMTEFIIKENEYLKCNVRAFYHSYYTPYGDGGSPTQYINILKNYPSRHTEEELTRAAGKLKTVLSQDIPHIKSILDVPSLTIVLAPRSKPIQEDWFQWLRRTVQEWTGYHKEDGYIDGCMYIIRQENSPMTHWGETGIYPGITSSTCTISNEIEGKDILFIDDIYTYGVNVDEDALQAVLNNNPKSITFYSIAKTLKKIN